MLALLGSVESELSICILSAIWENVLGNIEKLFGSVQLLPECINKKHGIISFLPPFSLRFFLCKSRYRFSLFRAILILMVVYRLTREIFSPVDLRTHLWNIPLMCEWKVTNLKMGNFTCRKKCWTWILLLRPILHEYIDEVSNISERQFAVFFNVIDL